MGLYVHIPFCASICTYCNITVRQAASPAVRAAYLGRLYKEAGMYAPVFERAKFQNVFLGGGTPNILEPEQIRKLFGVLRDRFHIAANADIVMDASPYFLDKTRLSALAECGLNGISIGGQSLDDGVIRRSNRTQDNSTIYEAYLRARRSGIRRVNVDVMVGLPGQSSASALSDIRTVAEWRPDEIFLGEFSPVNTLFARTGGTVLPSARTASRETWLKGFEILKEMGYHHRGEESFASLKPGARTWRGFFPFSGNSSILGLGLGAVSWAWGSARYQNLNSLSRYSQRISAGRLPVDDGCRVTIRQEMIHFILSGLECGWVSCREFESVFGELVDLRFGSHFRRLTACGVLVRRGDCYKLTDHPKAAFIYSKMFYEPVVAQRCLNKR